MIAWLDRYLTCGYCGRRCLPWRYCECRKLDPTTKEGTTA